MIIKENEFIPLEILLELYKSVGWAAYTNDPEKLEEAFENSTYIISAWEEGSLIGLVRGLCDQVSINFIQDILIHPQWSRKGVGTKLMKTILNKYKNVRKHLLLADDEEKLSYFYESLGFKNTRKIINNASINAYLIMNTN